MLQTLKLHPTSRSTAVTRVEVDVTRRDGHLVLSYVVTGTIKDLRIPAMGMPKRADELWKHTCFEAFLKPSPGTAYLEFNFAPSMQWAAYRFTDTRAGMSVAREIDALQIEVDQAPARYALQASCRLGLLGLPFEAPWRLGLSAVIEETSGDKSYWALAHPAPQPDFHHPDCFALELPPVSDT